MRPLTDHTPKPLLEAGGKPLIVWHIEKLARAGITELVINHAHLGEMIEQQLGCGSRFGVEIQYSAESQALDTAGGIANALPLLLPSRYGITSDQAALPPGRMASSSVRGIGGEGAPFAVINGDIYCDYDFSKLHERAVSMLANGDIAHLVLVDNPPHHPEGDFCLQADRIIPDRHPLPATDCMQLTFSGIGVYHPSLFSPVSRGSVFPLAPLLREKIAQGRISGEHHAGLWVDVGTPERLQSLNAQLNHHPIKAAHV